jgi:hypothetical protein
MFRRSATLLGTVLLLVLLSAMPAFADAPTVTDEWDDEFVGLSQFTEVCGFNVYVSSHETGVERTFVDSNGNPTHLSVHIRGAGTYWTDEGVTGFDRYALTIYVDLVNGDVILRGNNFNTHVPGSGTGIVINDSGQVTITSEGITINGPADTWEDWDAANQRFCDALSS